MGLRTRSLLLAAVMLFSMVSPLAAAQADAPEPNAFGIEYSWSNLDDDVLTLTGLSMESILSDVMDSADDAGMDLLLAQANTGSSSIMVYNTYGATTTLNGVEVQPRITNVGVTHGLVMDSAFDFVWDDATAEIDMAGSISWDNMLNLAITHTEYVDSDDLLHAVETTMTSVASQDLTLALAGSMSGGGETINIDTTFSIASGWEVTEGVLEVGLAEPSEVRQTMASMGPGDRLDWECTFDTGEMPASEMWGNEHWMMDVCDDVTGSYAGTSWFEVELIGAPSDLFDLPAGDWDVSISDSVAVSGDIEVGEYDGIAGWFGLTETSVQTITLADGSTLSGVLEADNAPLPLALGDSVFIIGEALAVSLVEELGSALESTIENNEFLSDLFDDDGGDGEDMFMCDDGDEIPWDWVNDGVEDCSNGEDEYEDDGSEDYFVCDDGEEIPWDWVNDGEDDCSNGEDEDEGSEDYFVCDDGEEIPWDWTNDGEDDCSNGEDEWLDLVEVWECMLFIEESSMTSDGMDAWDGTSLDLSICDTEVDWAMVETMGGGVSTLPTSWYMAVEDDGEDLMVHMERGMAGILYQTIMDWSFVTGDTTGDWCDGVYDSAEDTCTWELGEEVDVDDEVISFDDYENGMESILYGYDGTTGSGWFASAEWMFMCDSGDEMVHVDYVDDGWDDCADGSDEMGDDGEDMFMCDDGSEIYWDWVNDGEDDCPNGEDEGYVWTFAYDHCDDGEGLSSYACWLSDWDEDADGSPEYVEEYWNYECSQLTDGTWECQTDFVNYYDHCAYEDTDYYECWLSEWDTDSDGTYDLGSDGYWDWECSELTDGTWACNHSDDAEDGTEDGTDDETDDSGEWLWVDVHHLDANGMEVTIEANDLDPDATYELDWEVATYHDSGADTWDSGTSLISGTGWHSEDLEVELPGEPGEYCVWALLTNDGYIMDHHESCYDAEEAGPEPSEAVITVFEAIAESTFENALETFGQNLEVRMEDQTEVILYHDAMAYGLWDPATGSYVGAYMLVTEDETTEEDFACEDGSDVIPADFVNDGWEDCADGSDENSDWEMPDDDRTWVVLVGPTTDAYPAAEVGISVTYISGTAAVTTQTNMAEQDSIEDLVDLTDYDPYLVEAVQEGIDPTTVPEPTEDNSGEGTGDDGGSVESPSEGLLPAPGFAASLVVVAFAAIALRRRD